MTHKTREQTLDLDTDPTSLQISILDANLILTSELTCPKCHYKKVEIMPTNACQWFYECEQCHTLLKPKSGDCCVFCSFGNMKCPPIQRDKTGCCIKEE